MKDRIRNIMERENLSPSAFADKLGIGRAVISHILNGRNNPSLEVITRILETFKDVNSDWLLFGRGNMTIDDRNEEYSIPKSEYRDLFSTIDHSISEDKEEKTDISTKPNQTLSSLAHDANIERKATVSADVNVSARGKQITKIIIYYDDNSFQIFNPSNNSF